MQKVFLAIFLLFCCKVAVVASESTITVFGDAKISIVPDMATVKFLIKNEAQTAEEVQRLSKLSSDKLQNFLDASGIKDEDIKVINLGINTEKSGALLSSKTSFISYQDYSITLKELPKLAEFVTSLTNSVAISDIDVYFLNSKISQYKNIVLADAIKVAIEKASIMSKAADKRLGEVDEIEEIGDLDSYEHQRVYKSPPPKSPLTEQSSGIIKVGTRVKVKFILE